MCPHSQSTATVFCPLLYVKNNFNFSFTGCLRYDFDEFSGDILSYHNPEESAYSVLKLVPMLFSLTFTGHADPGFLSHIFQW